MDPIQYGIIKLLTGKNTHLCVVGDPDQTIYTWRGASVDIILKFNKDFEPCKTVILNENYRSTQPILDASNAVIKYNKERIDKDLYTKLIVMKKSQCLKVKKIVKNQSLWLVKLMKSTKRFRIQRYGDSLSFELFFTCF